MLEITGETRCFSGLGLGRVVALTIFKRRYFIESFEADFVLLRGGQKGRSKIIIVDKNLFTNSLLHLETILGGVDL